MGGVVDAYPTPSEPLSLTIRQSATCRILGSRVSAKEIEDMLGRLGFKTCERGGEAVTLEIPTHRLDIYEEIDLIEEVHGLRFLDARRF